MLTARRSERIAGIDMRARLVVRPPIDPDGKSTVSAG
jgi:hypothetical protein